MKNTVIPQNVWDIDFPYCVFFEARHNYEEHHIDIFVIKAGGRGVHYPKIDIL